MKKEDRKRRGEKRRDIKTIEETEIIKKKKKKIKSIKRNEKRRKGQDRRVEYRTVRYSTYMEYRMYMRFVPSAHLS